MRAFIDGYLRRRGAGALVGEFLDDEGLRGSQFGLAGTCFALRIAREEGISHPVTRQSTAELRAAIEKQPASRSPTEAHLAKDVGRIAAKTATLLLALENRDHVLFEKILGYLLVTGISDNGLIKPVLDDPAADGDAITTAHALHLMHLSGCHLDASCKGRVEAIVRKLREDMLAKSYSTLAKLLISSALCLFDYEGSIKHHRVYIQRLFFERESFKRVLSSDSAFLDRFYEDRMGQQSRTRNRYLRLPRGYVVLVSLYIACGHESSYFAFPLVKRILTELHVPYSDFAAAERSRSAVYYVYFIYTVLKPSEQFRVPRSHWLSRLVMRASYRIRIIAFSVATSRIGVDASIFLVGSP